MSQLQAMHDAHGGLANSPVSPTGFRTYLQCVNSPRLVSRGIEFSGASPKRGLRTLRLPDVKPPCYTWPRLNTGANFFDQRNCGGTTGAQWRPCLNSICMDALPSVSCKKI